MQKKSKITKRRDFLKKAGLVTAGAVGASTLPLLMAMQRQIQLSGDFKHTRAHL